jgi:hypothetical protein
MFEELPRVYGNHFKVCDRKCAREMDWRETLSILGKEYYPDPKPYEEI